MAPCPHALVIPCAPIPACPHARMPLLMTLTVRRFFCALPPSLRGKWAAKSAELLAPQGVFYTLMYPLDDHEGGPPYAVSKDRCIPLAPPPACPPSPLCPPCPPCPPAPIVPPVPPVPSIHPTPLPHLVVCAVRPRPTLSCPSAPHTLCCVLIICFSSSLPTPPIHTLHASLLTHTPAKLPTATDSSCCHCPPPPARPTSGPSSYAEVLEPLGFMAEDLPTVSVPPRKVRPVGCTCNRAWVTKARVTSAVPVSSAVLVAHSLFGSLHVRPLTCLCLCCCALLMHAKGEQGKEQLAKWVRVSAASKV
ncbi:unnamed protein product [Closterium sp. Naga37s-1]|nr:unnamed protein product [Closterium sp. Naga37s-1]